MQRLFCFCDFFKQVFLTGLTKGETRKDKFYFSILNQTINIKKQTTDSLITQARPTIWPEIRGDKGISCNSTIYD
jgi:hypothetical protein